ncbi:hypothetical protein H072_7964 [Dactylellina haptotyla CBS 200.50]|uniref:tRNA pseudouridine synthase 1 n=1 Tax=Dactylellina haptotyla (strain CBS 200.50) TaxID=1284197 RepID=S8BFZ8_DACHA|nr:hypothetical protein H072_7964 [Dactylellina haptotyla CBS 200.50]
MLDKVFEDIPPRVKGQNVIYTLGKIGNHTVAVVGYYQEHGLAVSGSMAAEVLRDLPNLELGLLVGIAGGIPSRTRNIQLGDVAVAVPEGDRPGVVGYDLGKVKDDDEFELKHWQNATHPLLRSVINVIRAHNEFKFRQHLRIIEERPEFQRPRAPFSSSGSDRLSEGGLSSAAHPAVHYGTILSGNSVIKSKARRDHLRDKAVIRGISDFADSTKNDAWHPYAAITAAAYAKEVLLRLPQHSESGPSSVPTPLSASFHERARSTPFSNQDVRLANALPERWAFVGRKKELSYLERELGYPAQQPLQKSVVCFWGLSGVGKTQLAATFVCQQRSNYPEREIFWISCESQEAFEQSVIDMLKVGSSQIPTDTVHSLETSREQRMRLINLFFVELGRLEDSRWLLVIDGANALPSVNKANSTLNIHSFLGRLKRGYVLLISRRRDVVEKYHPNHEIKGLKDEDATSLLQSQINKQLIDEGGMQELVRLLKGLPLALRLAISVVSRYRYKITEYVEIWKNRGADGELLGTDETLFRSMELSLQELEMANPVAAKILTLFSFLDHRDLWYDLCFTAIEDSYPTWLSDLARQRTPFRKFYPILADLAFIELQASRKSHLLWETHPAIQVVARQRVASNEQEYVCCAISLVAAQVPRSYEENFWETIRRLEPHASQCWSYIKQGKWGPNTNLTELECLGRIFRHVGRYEEASLIFRMIENGLGLGELTVPKAEFLADISTNLGLVYTSQRTLTPDASMSIMYNKAIVHMMTGRLDEAEKSLYSAADHFAQFQTDQHGLKKKERKRLHIRILNDIGEVLLQKDLVAKATQVFHGILENEMEVLGESHPTIVSIKLNLGRAYTRLNQFAIARSFLEPVVAIYTEWWGCNHADTMRAVEELGLALMKEGEQKQAAGMPFGDTFDIFLKYQNYIFRRGMPRLLFVSHTSIHSLKSITQTAFGTRSTLLVTSHRISRFVSTGTQTGADNPPQNFHNHSQTRPKIVYEDEFLSVPRLPHITCRLSRAYYLDLVGTRPRSYKDYMEQQRQERLASDVEGDGRKKRANDDEDSGNPEKKLKHMGRNEFKRAMKKDWNERKAEAEEFGKPNSKEGGRWDRRGKHKGKKPVPEKVEKETRAPRELAEGEEKEERKPKKKVAVLIGYCGTGYKGMQLNPPTKTIEGDLFEAFVKAGAISKANSDDPKKSSLVRCARTDKGVHAAGNVISLKLIIESPTVIEDINAQLVPQIRVWDIIPTTNGFSCYQFCDSRVYEYLVPTYCFLPPHPTSYMAKRVAKAAEEEGDLEGWKSRYDDSPEFWQKVAEETKAELQRMEFPEDVIQQVLNTKAEDSEEQLPSLLDDFPDLEKRSKSTTADGAPTEEKSAEIEEDSTMVDAEPSAIEDTVPVETDADPPTIHKYSKALSTARKLQKQIITRAKRAFRIPASRLERVRKAFELYEGNHSFHNFTIQKTFKDASSKRYIKTFKVSDPIIIDDTEWLSLKVHGQSFMMHQIRKMVGMVMLTVRYGCPLERINEAYGRVVVPIPKAPALGLLLDHPVFETYNKKADLNGRGHLEFETHKEKIQEFKQKNIYDKLFMEELKLNTFHAFLSFLDNFETQEFEYLTSRGMKSLTEVHRRKTENGTKSSHDEQLDALIESGDEENMDS